MQISSELQRLVNAGLKEVQGSAKHILSTESRHAIYRTICPDSVIGRGFFEHIKHRMAKESLRDFRQYAWLLIFTAKHVLPILGEFANQFESNDESLRNLITLPYQILKVAEDVATNIKNADEAFDLLCGDFYYVMCGVRGSFTYPVSCAIESTYDALEMLLYGYNSNRDVARRAVEAYSAIDKIHQEFGIEIITLSA